MQTIKPILNAAQKANMQGKKAASSAGIWVTSFSTLQREVAELSCLNKRYVLYFRGQGHDYLAGKGSALYPTIYRGNLYKTTYIIKLVGIIWRKRVSCWLPNCHHLELAPRTLDS